MLKLLVRIFYHDKIYTDELKTFYKLYKWNMGLYTFLSLQKVIFMFLFGIVGIMWLLFIKPKVYGLTFIYISLILHTLDLTELKKRNKFNTIGIKTKDQIRLMHTEEFIRKIISQNGKALGKKEWKKK